MQRVEAAGKRLGALPYKPTKWTPENNKKWIRNVKKEVHGGRELYDIGPDTMRRPRAPGKDAYRDIELPELSGGLDGLVSQPAGSIRIERVQENGRTIIEDIPVIRWVSGS